MKPPLKLFQMSTKKTENGEREALQDPLERHHLRLIYTYMVRRSAPKEARDRLWQAIAISLRRRENATPYL
jgi:hypothetical protein